MISLKKTESKQKMKNFTAIDISKWIVKKLDE